MHRPFDIVHCWPWLLTLALVILLAGGLRWGQISLRPLHPDEAVQAYQTSKLLKGEGYRYDPADKHGPFLYFFTASCARLASWKEQHLSETRLRSVSLIAGLSLFVLLATQTRRFGQRKTFVGLLFMAVAPLPILYHTYYVQEAWFAFFSWALLVVSFHAISKPSLSMGLLLGLLAGLMQTCKETSVLHFAATAIALLISDVLSGSKLREQPRAFLLVFFSALGMSLLTYAAFYSSFGAHAGGLIDGLASYRHYADKAMTPPHGDAWQTYLDIFMPHRSEGIWWSECLLLLCAAFGFLRIWKSNSSRLLRMCAVFTVVLLLFYGLIPYKTPWLLLTPYSGLCLLAGNGVVELWDVFANQRLRFLAPVLGLLCLTELGWRGAQALVHYAGDGRVPYFYQQTSPDFTRLVHDIEALEAGGRAPEASIAVCSPDHAWPLPWYLRQRTRCAYFSQAPAPEGYDLVLVDSRLPSASLDYCGNQGKPAGTYGLRPNVVLYAFSRSPREEAPSSAPQSANPR